MLSFGFDSAALLVCLALWVILSGSRILPIRQNSIYRRMLLLSTLSSASAGISFWLYPLPAWNHSILFIVLCLVNYISFNLIACTYVRLLVLSSKSKNCLSVWEKVIYIVSDVIVLIMAPISAFYKVFVFTPETIHDTFPDFFLYFVAAFNIFFGLFYVIKKKDFFDNKVLTIICVYTVLIVIIVMLNLFLQLKILDFGVALGLIFISMTLQDPTVMRDARSNSFNADAFDLIAKEWLSVKKTFSIFGIKIKNMNFINDKYGVEMGNRIVKYITPLSRGIFENSYIFHIRGAIFTIISEKMTEGQVWEFIDKLSNKVVINGLSISVDLASSIIRFPDVFSTEEEMYSLIDYMMDNSCHEQNSRIIFVTPEHLKKIQYESNVSSAVKKAVEDRSYQVYYQPIMNVETGEFETAEALARLIVPNIGFIPPDIFIQKAEKSGDIIAIGEIILDKVCKMIVSNKIENLGIKNIKVNLSVIQCLQKGMAKKIIDIIDFYAIDHKFINFEITESISSNSDSNFMENIGILKHSGFNFALDDYGTGYSNITRMISFHFDVLKLDKSIVWMAEHNEDAFISMKGTVDIANSLNMAVLAEGVETESQAKILKESGIKFFQGYLYSKPLPEYEYIEFMKQHSGNAVFEIQ